MIISHKILLSKIVRQQLCSRKDSLNFIKSVLSQTNQTYSNRPVIMKIDSPQFKDLFTPALDKLLSIFSRHNYEIRMAGGAVRDIVSGQLPKDVDFATTATPDEMKAMFTKEDIRMINMKGEKHGTITARIDNENFEVTTLRIDVATDGRHADVKFTKDWELDANRRDLTVNSMFLGADGTLYDYFGGYQDLLEKRIAFVGDPANRIKEDYLRILRYFRFYARIADDPDQHDADTIKAISDNVDGLQKISGERIWMELSKILSGRYVPHIMSKIIEVGAGKYIGFTSKPTVDELRTIYKRTEGLNPLPVTLLCSLLTCENDWMTLHERLKFSSFDRDLGRFIITYRESSLDLKRIKAMRFKPDVKDSTSKQYIIELLKYTTNLELIHEFQNWDPPRFPVSGNVLKQYSVPPGKSSGKVLSALKDIWIESDFQKSGDDLERDIPSVMEKLSITPLKSTF